MRLEFKKYIGVLFILLYSFPVVYQAVHIIKHQTHGAHEHSHCSNHHPKTTFYVEANDIDEEDCPICDYQFTLFDEGDRIVSEKYFPTYYTLEFPFAYPKVSTRYKNQNSSRAPPFFS